MCGSGGGDSPKAPDPMREAKAEIKRMKVQARLDAEARQAAAQEKAASDATARGEWQTGVSTARTAAQRAIEADFRRAGLDPAMYMRDINAALDQEQSGMSFGSPTSFGTDIGENIMSDIRGSKVRELGTQVNAFAPEGFEQTAFAGTADDAILDAILGQQYGEASSALMRAKERGNLNDTGFTYAMSNLDTQKTAGSSRLQALGGGVLEGYRGQLGDIAERARSGASSWDFGDTYNPTTYKSQLDTLQGELTGRLEGDIRNTVGGEQFFDISDLIQRGGVAQGAQNTGVGGQEGGLLAAIAKRKQDEEKTRGLGTQGSF